MQDAERIGVRAGLALFLILLACSAYFPPKGGRRDWAASARADLVWAVADHGVLHIDRYHDNTGDKSYFGGHYYAPGSIGPSLLALPAYLAFRAAAGLPPVSRVLAARPGRRERAALAAMTFAAASVPAALLGVLVFLFARRIVSRDSHALVLALTYGLGTIAFPYSKTLAQHQVAAFGMFAGFFLLWRVVREGASPAWLWAVGVLFSLSAISEYPTAPFLALLFLWAAVESEDRWALARVVAGALPLVALFAAYNDAIFGTPLPVGYRYHVEYHAVHAQGFMGLAGPTWRALAGITISPYRGILLISPVLLLAIPGLLMMWRDGRYRTLAATVALLLGGFLLYNASYLYWWGGRAVGPRFLVPALPFAFVPIGFTFERWLRRRWGRWTVGALVLVSGLNVWTQTIGGDGAAPEEIGGTPVTNPLVQYAIPRLVAGDVAPNYGMALGLRGLPTLLPLLLVVVALIAAGTYRRMARSSTSAQPPSPRR